MWVSAADSVYLAQACGASKPAPMSTQTAGASLFLRHSFSGPSP